MEFRNCIGIFIIVIGTSLQIYGFYAEGWVSVVSFIIIFLGLVIFGTQRYIARKESSEFNFGPSQKSTSLPIMGDIFNSSGQRTGGRTEDSWSSDSSGGDCGGGAD
ncbi:hypothetical protein [Alteromonas sp. KUL49]|uniref:hypothetical protein n=1 Tax=Alteromonas sp. KUL49 TaxID=2480798 RepID=UPI00102F1242|nr:hypothetical protein [Alteromonas sp. KUL49]TAP40924.1 hypothetical protein EYS00_07400 [Alteromonas sp. KUL49]GEA11105.1 hypothetical protein KUL49_14800 [Alteromonas sp. KUL49]